MAHFPAYSWRGGLPREHHRYRCMDADGGANAERQCHTLLRQGCCPRRPNLHSAWCAPGTDERVCHGARPLGWVGRVSPVVLDNCRPVAIHRIRRNYGWESLSPSNIAWLCSLTRRTTRTRHHQNSSQRSASGTSGGTCNSLAGLLALPDGQQASLRLGRWEVGPCLSMSGPRSSARSASPARCWTGSPTTSIFWR